MICGGIDSANPWGDDYWTTMQTQITSAVRIFVAVKMATFCTMKFKHPNLNIFDVKPSRFAADSAAALSKDVAMMDLVEVVAAQDLDIDDSVSSNNTSGKSDGGSDSN